MAAAQQHDYEQARLGEKRQQRLRRHQRLFTIMYNLYSVGELVYFIVGLYLIQWQVADLQDNPLLGPGPEGVIKMGGTHTPRIVQRRQYWRLVTSLFYNAGAIHLTANLGLVWTFGHFLVRALHPAAVAFIFLGSGLAGVVFSANIGARHMTAAASIPAFGLMGATAAMLIFRWRRFTSHFHSVLILAIVLGVNAFVGSTPFVDNAGNTAGLVFGAVLCIGLMLVTRETSGGKGAEAAVYSGAIVAVLAVLAAVIAGLIGLQLDTPVAGCCDRWVCTPSPWWDCDASRIWGTTCTYTTFLNGTALLECPRGESVTIGTVNATAVDEATVAAWCGTYCLGAAAPTAAPGEGLGARR